MGLQVLSFVMKKPQAQAKHPQSLSDLQLGITQLKFSSLKGLQHSLQVWSEFSILHPRRLLCLHSPKMREYSPLHFEHLSCSQVSQNLTPFWQVPSILLKPLAQLRQIYPSASRHPTIFSGTFALSTSRVHLPTLVLSFSQPEQIELYLRCRCRTHWHSCKSCSLQSRRVSGKFLGHQGCAAQDSSLQCSQHCRGPRKPGKRIEKQPSFLNFIEKNRNPTYLNTVLHKTVTANINIKQKFLLRRPSHDETGQMIFSGHQILHEILDYFLYIMRYKLMQEPSSPQKKKEPYLSPPRSMSKNQTDHEIQTQESVKKYNAVPDSSFNAGHSAPSSYLPPQTSRKKSSDLGLIQGQDEDQEQAQNTHVQMDLFKGIGLMAKSKQLAAVSGLLGAFAIHLIVGAIYRWNMITEYVGAFYETDQITPIGAPMSMLFAGMTMRIGAKIGSVLGSRFILSVGASLAVISILFASQMDNFWMFLLFHNVLFGLSAGLLFLTPIIECHKFFPKLKLITNSIILTGTGLGAVFFGATNIECIGEDEETKGLSDLQMKSIIDREFSPCFLKMGAYVFLIGLSGILMMVPMILKNEERAREERQVSVEERSGNFCPNECTAFKSRVFWMVGLFIFLSTCGNYYVIMNFKNLLAVEYQQRAFLYWILISGALANGLPRLIWGFLFSRIGFKTLFLFSTFLNLLSFLVIMATNDKTAYIIFYTINSFSLGGLMVIFPNAALIIFGKKIGDQIYGYYWIIFSLSNLFQFVITLILTNQPETSDDFGEVLFFFAICVILAGFLCYREMLKGPWNNSQDLIQFGRNKRVRKYST